nr:hypothetical protein [uncultured Rhodopila sp.]
MNVTEALTNATKGTVTGIGGLVLDIAPGIGTSLLGGAGEKTAGQVARAIESVTGTSDADAAQAVLARDPEAVSHLQVQLLTIMAQQQAEADRAAEAQRAADLAMLQAVSADRAGARGQTAALVQAHSRLAWAPAVLSGIILVVFGALIFVVLTKPSLPENGLPLANVLLGTVAAMATQVANYWLGSSSGSAVKSDQMAALSVAAQNLVPGDVVHRLLQQGAGGKAPASL